MNFTLDRIFSEMLRCAAEKAKLESCSSQDKAVEKQPISMAELSEEKQISKKRKLERAIETVKIRKLNALASSSSAQPNGNFVNYLQPGFMDYGSPNFNLAGNNFHGNDLPLPSANKVFR
ncbi:hypothetical protein WR25_22042 [Diploscapter pachys]|uniref:Uncharacterized protein n=1 Tax=Diploscapter pachys TaxID=2018661 RepID=A0A2A2LEC4_9BILA|nr:hypothetical protein WR25_22042 [Diploscapter pachys]